MLLLFGEMVDLLIQNPDLHQSKIRFLDWLDSIVLRDVTAHDNSLSLLWQGVEFKFVGFSCCFVVVPHIDDVHPLHFLLCCQPIILPPPKRSTVPKPSRMNVVIILHSSDNEDDLTIVTSIKMKAPR
jgi:hypothetical protein